MDTDSFTLHAKTDDIYKDIVKDAETDLTVQIMSQNDHHQKERAKRLLA